MSDNACLHEFHYERIDGDGYASKWATCVKCGLKTTIYKEVGKQYIDKNTKYDEEMARRYIGITKELPDLSEDSRVKMAISLFIKTGGNI